MFEMLLPAQQMMNVTLIDILPLVERPEAEVVGKSAERVDEMSAQVRIDILREEFGGSRPVGGPVGVVAHHPLATATFAGHSDHSCRLDKNRGQSVINSRLLFL